MLWPHLGFGHEATYQQYSFCATIDCIKTGTQVLQKRGVEHPPFENLLGIETRFEKKIEGNQAAKDAIKALEENGARVVAAKAPWITEEFWVFNEYTRMTRGE